jgi:molybdate transport system ATP-binding protein
VIRIKARKRLRDFTLDADIEAGPGETVVLMGSNGSGKTTVLNIAAGLVAPDEGLVAVSSRTLYDSAQGIDIPPEKRNVGYVFQHYALFPHMTVFDNVAFGLRMRKAEVNTIERKVREELEPLGMWEQRDVRASKLSGGQRQKVALARSLAVEPALLLLDEPLSALDMGACASIRDSLKMRIGKDRITTILVTHSMRDASALGNRVYVLDCGKVIRSGTPADILETVSQL